MEAVVQEKEISSFFFFFWRQWFSFGGCPSGSNEELLKNRGHSKTYRIKISRYEFVCVCVCVCACVCLSRDCNYNHCLAATPVDCDSPPTSFSPFFSVSGLWIWFWHVWLGIRNICWAHFLDAHKSKRNFCVRISRAESKQWWWR